MIVYMLCVKNWERFGLFVSCVKIRFAPPNEPCFSFRIVCDLRLGWLSENAFFFYSIGDGQMFTWLVGIINWIGRRKSFDWFISQMIIIVDVREWSICQWPTTGSFVQRYRRIVVNGSTVFKYRLVGHITITKFSCTDGYYCCRWSVAWLFELPNIQKIKSTASFRTVIPAKEEMLISGMIIFLSERKLFRQLSFIIKCKFVCFKIDRG